MDRDLMNMKKWLTNLGLEVDGKISDDELKKYVLLAAISFPCALVIRFPEGYLFLEFPQINAAAAPRHVAKHHETRTAQRQGRFNQKVYFVA